MWGQRGPRLRYQQESSGSGPEWGTFYRTASQWHQKGIKGRHGWLFSRPSWVLSGHSGPLLSMSAGSTGVTWCSRLPCLRLPSGIPGMHSAIEQNSPEVTLEGWESQLSVGKFGFLRVSPAEFKHSYPQSWPAHQYIFSWLFLTCPLVSFLHPSTIPSNIPAPSSSS